MSACRPGPWPGQYFESCVLISRGPDAKTGSISICVHRRAYSVQCSDKIPFPQLRIKCGVAKSQCPAYPCSSASMHLQVSNLAAFRRDPGARVLSLATLWPRPSSQIYSTQLWKLKSLDSSATATACTRLYKLASYMRRHTDNCSAVLGQSSLRSNLRAFNFPNFPGGEYPRHPPPPPARAWLRAHTNRSPPNLNVFRRPLVSLSLVHVQKTRNSHHYYLT